MLLSTLWPNSLPVVVAQPDERHENRTAVCVRVLDSTEHSTTSGLCGHGFESHSQLFLLTYSEADLTYYF